jgi:ubiquinone/menaquinone biosynthesis C-methylase UbiE
MACERLYVGDGFHVQEEAHLDRYRFASDRITPGATVLDAACGSGYGTEILSQKAGHVIGVDISDQALVYAKQRYGRANIEFKRADLCQGIDLPDGHCDTVVSFETLEHVPNQHRMLSEFHRLLRPGGTLIISTPDREIITEKAHEENEFHISELSKEEFIRLLSRHFEITELYGQIRYESRQWRLAVRKMARLDVFGVRRYVSAWRPAAMLLGPRQRSVEQVALLTPGEHMYLIAVAASDKERAGGETSP